MKYNNLIKDLPRYDNEVQFVKDYLTLCGVENAEAYLEADVSDINFYPGYGVMNNVLLTLPNYREAQVYIVVDCDCDGLFSSAILIDYLQREFDMCCYPLIHDSKIHGLDDEDIMVEIMNNPLPLVFIPDASGTSEQCKKLKECGVEHIFIFDHHDLDDYHNEYAHIISNQCPTNICNTKLSGTGVTWNVITTLKNNLHLQNTKNDLLYYADMVACSLISDMCSLNSIENRALIDYGLSHINNPFLKELFDYYMKDEPYTGIDVAFNVIPKLNAAMRYGETHFIRLLLQTFVNPTDNMHQIIHELNKCYRYQTEFVKTETERIMEDVHSNVVITDGLSNYTGLVANRILGNIHEPIAVLSSYDSDTQTYYGSMRSNFELRHLLNDSGITNWCRGHEQAFGISVQANKVGELRKYLQDLTTEYNIGYNVVTTLDAYNIPYKLLEVGEHYKWLWGEDIPYPEFGFNNIVISSDDIQIIGRNNTTIKFQYGNYTFIKFFVSETEKERLGLLGKHKQMLVLDIVGRLNLNVWNETETPQVIIQNFETSELNDWSHMF